MIEYCCLASSSSGNCHFIKMGNTRILLDVGMSARYVVNSLRRIGEKIEDIDYCFISHGHSDHVKGLKVLKKNYNFEIFAHKTIMKVIDYLPEEEINFFNGDFNLDDISVGVIKLPHDYDSTFGFSFKYKDSKISIITDLGYAFDRLIEFIKLSDFLVIEANHEENMVESGPYPYRLKKRILGNRGHISNRVCANIISEAYTDAKPAFVLLAHLSETNNYPDICKLTVESELKNSGIIANEDIIVEVASSRDVSGIYQIGG
ncbi:MAG: hypothetical protein CSB16_01475 [Clostridiales bacterium]|nr:MAG: hypothetical protein CSB16_01475 [Clostridiales bacterium]